MKTYVIDIDGTICSNTFGRYEDAEPYISRILYINKLFDRGHIIKLFTARGSGTGIDWTDLTKKQLSLWGLKYHQLTLGKPEGDIFIDDKAFNSESWNWSLSKEVQANHTEDDYFVEINKSFNDHINVLNDILGSPLIKEKIVLIASSIRRTLQQSGKVLLAGNGGSFSDSQHIAAEFVSKLLCDRCPLPALALGTNSSNLTAIGNDYGFEMIFSREFECIASNNDVLLAFTTSGKSKNILNLIEKAKEMSVEFFILTGKTGGNLPVSNDRILNVPSDSTALIQQVHIQLGHILVLLSEKDFIKK